MIANQCENKLYSNLENFFSKYGYQLLIHKKQFRKTTPTGFQNIILSVSATQEEIWIEVNFGIRNNQVEQLAQQFLNIAADYQADANTLVVSIGKFNDLKYFRFKIEGNDDLEVATEQIIDFFKQRGLKFLEQLSPLANLEKTLNNDPNKPCKYLYNQVHRAFKGIIAAKLVNSPKFSNLIEVYRNTLFKMATDEELINFERLVSFLLYFSPN